jgi:hypothetical protein
MTGPSEISRRAVGGSTPGHEEDHDDRALHLVQVERLDAGPPAGGFRRVCRVLGELENPRAVRPGAYGLTSGSVITTSTSSVSARGG